MTHRKTRDTARLNQSTSFGASGEAISTLLEDDMHQHDPTNRAFSIPPPAVANTWATDMNNISPAQRQFLQEVQSQPDRLERILRRMNILPWRFSMWMRRPGFRRALTHVLKGL